MALVLIAVATALGVHRSGTAYLAWTTVPIDSESAVPDGGHAVSIGVGTLWMSAHRTGQSVARVLENGVGLATPDARHDDIRDFGRGRFSLWGGRLFWSASDNSDPRTNGRRYELVWPLRIHAGVLILAWLASLGATFRALLATARAPRAVERFGRLTAWTRALEARITASRWNDPVVLSGVAFALAVVVHGLFWTVVLANPAEYSSGYSVMGVPYSDARGWHELGARIAEGHGLEGAWSALRPLYGMFLALFYVWTGPSYTLAIVLNLLLGALTAMLVLLIAEHAFGRLCGAAAGLAFAIGTPHLEHAVVVSTEMLGLFLFALSVLLMLRGARRGSAAMLFLAGVSLALSNLTRPLTIVGLPLFVAWVAIATWRRTGRPARALGAMIALGLGVAAPLAPWLARQYAVHGIVSISGNTASGLYAATTPKYGYWTNAVEAEADAAGVPNDIRARYDFFMAGARANLAESPGFYVRNVLRSAGESLSRLRARSAALRLFGTVVLAVTFLLGLRRLRERRQMVAWSMLALALALGCWMLPSLDVVAAACVLVALRPGLALVLAGLSAVLGSALFGLGGDPRLQLMAEWVLPPLALGTLVRIQQIALARLAPGGNVPTAAPASAVRPPRWLVTPALALGAAFVLFGGARLAWINFVRGPVPRVVERLTEAEIDLVEAAVRQRCPTLVAAGEDARKTTPLATIDAPSAAHGDLFIGRGYLERDPYPLPAHVRLPHWSRYFAERDYDRTIARFVGVDAKGNHGAFQVIIDGPLPAPLIEADVVLAARVDVDATTAYEYVLLEAIAVIPWRAGLTADELMARFDCPRPEHQRVLRSLGR
jgi:4-amino-4-deoxy-L-arabinose transferase-like glycosyltransferase